MNDIETIKINEVEYVRADSIQEKPGIRKFWWVVA